METNYKKSSLGLNENIISIIPYLSVILSFFNVTKWFCWVIPIIIFFVETKSVFVKKNSVLAFIIYVLELAMFGIIYILFSSNEVCAWGSCQEIPRYLTTNGSNMIFAVSVVTCLINAFLAYKAFKYDIVNVPGLNTFLNKITGNLNTLKSTIDK